MRMVDTAVRLNNVLLLIIMSALRVREMLINRWFRYVGRMPSKSGKIDGG